MQSEVRSVPPAPRRVRMRSLLAHRWPLLSVGGALTVIGLLVAWAMFLQSGGKFADGPQLQEGETRVVQATITKVGPRRHFDGADWNWVDYKFSWVPEKVTSDKISITIIGGSFAPADRLTVDATAPVKILIGNPTVNCVVGGIPHTQRQWLYAQFWLIVLVVPGALILLTWLAGVFQLRHVLMHGDVSVGRVTSIQPVRWILPEMLHVGYEFRDHRARMRRNRHWVRAHGSLGSRLRARRTVDHGEALPVLHDRRMPHWNRLLLPQDFLKSNESFDRDLPKTV